MIPFTQSPPQPWHLAPKSHPALAQYGDKLKYPTSTLTIHHDVLVANPAPTRAVP